MSCRVLSLWVLGLCVSLVSVRLRAADVATTVPGVPPIILDMVHNNPGEPPTDTEFNDPALLKKMGYTGKVFFLFESAQLAVDWQTVDPTIFPEGSDGRKWVDAKAADLDAKYSAAKAAGLQVFCECDMVLLPKALVEKNKMADFFGDPGNAETQKQLGLLLEQMFTRFPELDGIVVRIGETYLQDAPYHLGKIGVTKTDKTDPQKTIIPLAQFLEKNVCEKLHKKVIFRTWLSFDTDVQKFETVAAAVPNDPNFFFSIKHCEGDFNRGNAYSKLLNLTPEEMHGHPFIVEVECQREYEGKGAYPNYIANGVIDGFEEYGQMTAGHSLTEVRKNPLFSGCWTWTRGGGWQGPYITKGAAEIWCQLNASVLVDWLNHPGESEEQAFGRYCAEVVHLSDEDAKTFRKLALLSADAVIRGKRSMDMTKDNTISPFWDRDDKTGAPPLPKNRAVVADFLKQKDDAVADWEQIVSLADSIKFADAATGEYVTTSARYGLYVYRIYRAGFNLAALGKDGDPEKIKSWVADYDQDWADLTKLKEEHPSCASLIRDVGYGSIAGDTKPGIGAFVEEMRHAVNGG